MIEVFASATPNCVRVPIALEELEVDYPNMHRWYEQVFARPAVARAISRISAPVPSDPQ